MTPPRLLPSPVSPLSPRILVVVTLDAERYTRVDLADVLDHGPIIRSRILNKLGICADDDQARALIFETEIGSLHIGQPLTDQSLAVLCRERGDGKGSLAFIVDRGSSPTQSSVSQTPPQSTNSSATNSPNDPTSQMNYTQSTSEQKDHPSNGFRSPPHRPSRPPDITTEGNSGIAELQPRRVRPLPAIPTSTSLGGVSSSNLPAINDNHDTYDSAPDVKISHAPSHVWGQENTRVTNRSLRQLTIPSQRPRSIPSADHSPSPSISSKWVRGELIGGNGVDSRVYMALDAVSGQIMAVKQKEIPKADLSSLPAHISLADQAKRSFLEAIKFESELLRVLDHKNIVKHFFFEETDTTVNIFMEYVSGGTLRGFLRSFGPFSENVTKFLTTQILDGLAYLHSHHILHRDLRAESILVQQDGVCKISDFAVSKFADTQGLVYTALQGSTFWMAPEVITTKIHGGGYTAKVDIWSLGCLVLEMWSNGRPWTGLDASRVMQRLSDALPPPLPDGFNLSRKAKDFYDQCFIVDPSLRPLASELVRHCYLDLPDDWIFSLPPERLTDGVFDFDVTHLATPTPIPRVVDKVPSQFCLHSFPRYSSSGLQPSDWLRKNLLDLLEYINQSKYDLQKRQECSSWVKEYLLFPRLIIFACETMYDLEELRTTIHYWQSWNTRLAALIHYHEVNDKLLSFYEDLDQVEGLKDIISLDVDTICVYLHSIVTIEESFRQMLDLRGNEAQSILDLLQMLLDYPTLATEFRRHFMNAMLKLSRRSGLHPSSLLQHQVLLEGSFAIASGQFGDVWKGTFRNQQVAVKVLRIFSSFESEKHLNKVLRETLIWRQLRHPNVLPFFCLCHVQNDKRRIGLVSPWMNNGNLKHFLQRTFDANRVSLMIDIAEGLDYLHNIQPVIVHGDLKAVNILITDTCRACLADFGLSTASKSQVLNLSSFSSDQAGGTARWTAPELLNGSQSLNTTQSDVYSFGCVCYEIFSGEIPFSEITLDPAVIYKVTVQYEQPHRPTNCKPHGKPSSSLGLDDHLWDVVTKCWTSNPYERPTMSNVMAMLPPRELVQAEAEKYFQPPPDYIKWNLIAWASNTPVS